MMEINSGECATQQPPTPATKTTTTTTDNAWEGKSVSIKCHELGIFQGVIKSICSEKLTIIRAFRNGVPLKRQHAEVTLYVKDIERIEMIADLMQNNDTPTMENIYSCNGTPIKQATKDDLSAPYKNNTEIYPFNVYDDSSGSIPSSPSISSQPFCTRQFINDNRNGNGSDPGSPPIMMSCVAAFFNNMIPPKVEARLASVQLGNDTRRESEGDENNLREKIINETTTAALSSSAANNKKSIINYHELKIHKSNNNNHNQNNQNFNINGNNNNNNNNNNGRINGNKKGGRKQTRQNSQTFGTSANDPMLNEDFDFESNLALFDKQALWQTIETGKETKSTKRINGFHGSVQQKYRHDENILDKLPATMHQTQTDFNSTISFVTDDGQKIPTIPLFVRAKIEIAAHDAGFRVQRQIDMLARGATEIAMMLLGGARRLAIANYHQWPKVIIVCEKSEYFRATHVGAATGRQLASQGLEVFLYTAEEPSVEEHSREIGLFKATDSPVFYSVHDLPQPDIVILSTNLQNTLSDSVIEWLKKSRASIMAIDPPPGGVNDVNVKYAILPILPLNGINPDENCKLFLCNIGIPDKYFRDAGIKYKSPFGHKFVIPLYLKD